MGTRGPRNREKVNPDLRRPAKELYVVPTDGFIRNGAEQHRQYGSKWSGITPRTNTPGKWRPGLIL